MSWFESKARRNILVKANLSLLSLGKYFICSAMSTVHWGIVHTNCSPLFFYRQTIAWKFSDRGRYFQGGQGPPWFFSRVGGCPIPLLRADALAVRPSGTMSCGPRKFAVSALILLNNAADHARPIIDTDSVFNALKDCRILQNLRNYHSAKRLCDCLERTYTVHDIVYSFATLITYFCDLVLQIYCACAVSLNFQHHISLHTWCRWSTYYSTIAIIANRPSVTNAIGV